MPATGAPSRGRAISAYIRALLDHWRHFITSGVLAAGAALAINAFGVTIPGWLYALVFLWFGVIVAGFKAWEVEYREAHRVELEPKPRVTGPRLSLRFDPDDPFCVGNVGGDETFRVQVVNEGDARANDVRVVLEQMEPKITKYLHQRFSVMKGGPDSFSVSPLGTNPAAYVDVLYRQRHASYGFNHILRLPHAEWLQPGLTQLKLVLRLQAEVPTEPLVLVFVAGADKGLYPVVPTPPPD